MFLIFVYEFMGMLALHHISSYFSLRFLSVGLNPNAAFSFLNISFNIQSNNLNMFINIRTERKVRVLFHAFK